MSSNYYHIIFRIPGGKENKAEKNAGGLYNGTSVFWQRVYDSINDRTAELLHVGKGSYFTDQKEFDVPELKGKFDTFYILQLTLDDVIASDNEAVWNEVIKFSAYSNWQTVRHVNQDFQIVTSEYLGEDGDLGITTPLHSVIKNALEKK